MANTIKDAKTSALGAMMDVTMVVQEFASEWLEPEIRRAEAMMELRLLDEWDAHQKEIEAMKDADPVQYAKALKQIDELRKKYKGIGG